jgi:16S rRNA (cytosine967-C5)-methyltransferase
MSDSAAINRAARVLVRVSPQLPADAALREEMVKYRQISPAEQREVARTVFAYYRWFQWLDQEQSLQARLATAVELHRRFSRDPASIKAEALAARALPEWAREEMALAADDLRALQRDPVLWIRAQREHASGVARVLGHCTPAPAPANHTGFRYTGPKDLFKTDEFHQGLFEIQDLASQLVSHACAPEPGETWWDACAGEGGKLLHLADLMQNKGLIWASDRSPRRIAHLRKRTARAKVFNYRVVNWNGGPILPTKTKFDGILVDAPCSGAGTWGRNPHARWTTTLEDVRELATLQGQLLEHVSGALKPGGRLVYAVCTLTRSETTAVADAFTAAHPELEPLPLLGRGTQVTLAPHEFEANGMFLAGWRKR